jgi:membrane fusion protein, multidrug efflux system
MALIVDAEGKVQRRMLIIDRAIEDNWLVSSGLASGDRLVVEGMQKIRAGASVKVTPFDAARKAEATPGNTARPDGKAN